MKTILFFLFAIFAFALGTENSNGTNWAVLVAGSRFYYNYRHQSDVCHAFQILNKKGHFPTDKIIVMMYDDIAYNRENPFKGNIINKPNGPNVYPGVNKDYTGNMVTKENFLNVLMGKEEAMKGIGSGKVIKSGPNDRIFVYFTDHGAVGLVAFPVGGYLYAHELIGTLKEMYENKKYKQFVFYMEACEAGSMFDQILNPSWDIFATTATDARHSSYAHYWDPSRRAYLGDEYSIHWMEDSDAQPFSESLQKQFETVKRETKMSPAQEYGDKMFDNEPIGDFQGYQESWSKKTTPIRSRPFNASDYVDQRDAKLVYLQRREALANNVVDRLKYSRLVKEEEAHRDAADKFFHKVVETVIGFSNEIIDVDTFMNSYHRPRNFDCLKSSVDLCEAVFGKFSDYSLKYVKQLVNLCEYKGFTKAMIHNAIISA